MGDLIKISDYLKKKKEKEGTIQKILSTAEKIKKALEKYGSHKKNPNNDKE